ncbi:MAG: immunoglobulin domain-containing protein [Bacteroidales bacterium]|nr:immunoglobulin domain-containing protein [Bacteroidales bacterium]
MIGRERKIISLILFFSLLFFGKLLGADIRGWRNSPQIYCASEIDDTVYGIPASAGKPFLLINPDDGSELHFDFYPQYITKLDPGDGKYLCIIHFDSIYARWGAGTYTLRYGTWGSGSSYEETFDIISPVVGGVWLYSLPKYNACIYDGAFSLFNADSSNVSPNTGLFYIDGTLSTGSFNPATWGVGTHDISYMVTAAGCTEWAYDVMHVTVNDRPTVIFDPLDTVCDGNAAFDLESLGKVNQTGGSYSGTGVSYVLGQYIFNPAVTGTGTFPITYTYTDIGTGCVNSDVSNQVVLPGATASFSGLSAKYCKVDSTVILTGSPSGGTWVGSGVTPTGPATAIFNPNNVSLGTHQISYIYGDPLGCIDTATQSVQVGTPIEIRDLNSPYCESDANVVIRGICTTNGNLVDSFATFTGMTNLVAGKALFSPSTSGAGSYIATIYFTDTSGCMNIVTEPITVNAIPFVEISNLDTSYCLGGDTAYITGNYATGTFSGDISPYAPGVGMLVPADLGVGGPFDVTYTYTNANGCTNSVTEQTKVFGDPAAKISGNTTICRGDTTDITIVFTQGQQPFDFSYQSSRTGATYSYTGFANDTFVRGHFPVDTTIYSLLTVTDANGCSATGTGSAYVKVRPHAEITSNPQDIYACEGDDDFMEIDATCINCTFQWQQDGVDIPGATNSYITFTDIDATFEGAYKCVVNSDCGPEIESDTAQIVLWENTSIDLNPSDKLHCEGDLALFTFEATASHPVYQWRLNNQPVSDTGSYSMLVSVDSSSTTLIIDPVTSAYAGNYTCRVAGECGTLTSDVAVLTVDTTILIINDLEDITACPGDDVQFITSAIGSNKTYRWEKNGVTIPGEIDPSLAIISVTQGDAGEYRCWVKSPCGDSLATQPAQLTVNKNINLTSNPTDATRCEGDNVNFIVTTIGDSLNTTYQWIKDDTLLLSDGGNISGSNDHNLWLFNLTTADMGTYKCLIIGLCDTIMSTTATLVVDTNITIVKQPVSKSACEGSNVNFTAIANGGAGVTYQWQKEGVNIPGATTTTLTLTLVTSADSGAYRCIVKNACGDSAVSNTAVFTLNRMISLVSGPTDQTICEGDNISLTLAVTPVLGVPISYQWRFNGSNLLDTGSVSNSNQATLTLNNVPGDNYQGSYSCVATGPCNSVSDNAFLFVNSPVAVTAQPTGADICSGEGHLFEVSEDPNATGYQWFKDGAPIAGEDQYYLYIVNATTADSGAYFCVVYGDCENDTSINALLSVRNALSITASPLANKTACEGEQVLFRVITNPSSAISYQWLENGSPLQDTGNVSNSDDFELLLDPVTSSSDGAFYACMVWDACGDTMISGSSLLKVNEGITITKQPQNKTACENDNISFMILAPGVGISKQWYKDGVLMPGDTNNTLQIDTVDYSDAGTYYCVVMNACDSFASQPATLTVNYRPIIADEPTNQTACLGGSATFSITVPDSVNATFQWVNTITGPVVPDARITVDASGYLTFDVLQATDAGNYYCRVMNSCDTITSETRSLTVSEPITIGDQPLDHSVCSGDTVYLRVSVAAGANPVYQWQKNGVNIAGANAADYTIAPAYTADSGVYRCLITGTCSPTARISNNAVVVVDSAISLLNSLTSKNACTGQDIGFQILVSGTNPQYQWSKGGTPLVDGAGILGANDDLLTLFTVDATYAGLYSVTVTNSCGSRQDAALLSVQTTPTFTLNPSDITQCAGFGAGLSVATSTVTGVTYQWYHNGIALPGETNIDLIIDSLAMVDAGLYRCDAYYMCNGVGDTLTGNTAMVTVLDSIVITSEPPDYTECKGDNVTLQVLGTFNDSVVYQWYKMPGLAVANLAGKISGAQSNSLTINDLAASDEETYYCRLSGCHTKISRFSKLQLIDTTAITSQPIDAYAAVGGDAEFIVGASGDSLTYQWYKDGVALVDGGVISDALTDHIVLTGVSAADEGDYHCVVSGWCDLDLAVRTSFTAHLYIIDSSLIITQPTSKTRCEDESVTFTAALDNPSSHTFQWYKGTTPLSNNGRIAGVTSNILSINPVVLSDAGQYSCMIDDTVERSKPATLVVNANTNITRHPADASVCEGNNVRFDVEAEGYLLTYTWFKQGIATPIAGFTNDYLDIDSALKADEGGYYVVVDGACGTDSLPSFIADLKVTETPVITSGITSDTVCEGITKLLSVGATGDSLNYRWTWKGFQISDTGSYSGTSTNDLTILNTPEGYGGYYQCIVYNNCSNTSTSAQITVMLDPKIIDQPDADMVCEGSNAYFLIRLEESTDTLVYQWYHNGVALVSDGIHIIGADTNFLEINNVVSADAGTYECRITSTCDPVLVSNNAELTVNGNTFISQDPKSDTLCEGDQALFTITAGPAALITYQWYKNLTPLTSGGRIQGATSAQLTINNLVPADAGSYWCEVTGPCGAVQQSKMAYLTVNQTIVPNTQPSIDHLCEGEDATFRFDDVDGTNLTYQWTKNNVPLVSDGVHIVGATDSILLVNNVVQADSGSYVCEVRGECDTSAVRSIPAILHVSKITLYTAPPVSDTICEHQPANFSISTNHTDLIYQWYKDGNILSNNTNIVGATSPLLNILDASTTDAGSYWCEVQGFCDNSPQSSFTAELLVDVSTDIIDTVFGGGNQCVGASVDFLVNTQGSSLSFQWYKGNISNPLADGGNISGATTNRLTLTNISLTDAGDYFCIVTGTGKCVNQAISNTKRLTVAEPVVITLPPVGDTVCEGTATVRFEVNGTGASSYQWMKGGLPLRDTANYIGSSTNELYINAVTVNNRGVYSCLLSGTCLPSKGTDGAFLEVNELLNITTNPVDDEICENGYTSFRVNVDNEDSVSYQWTKGGVPLVEDPGHITGVDAPILYVNNALLTDDGPYQVNIGGSCNSDTRSATLTVNPYPDDAGTIFGPDTVCQGAEGLIFSVAYIPNASHVWTVTPGITIVSGQGTNQIIVDIGNSILGGTIRVQGVNGCGNGAESPVKTLTVNPVPYVYAGENVNLCGTSTTLNANSLSSGFSGVWTIVRGFANIDDDTLYNTAINSINQGDNVFQWTVSGNGCSAFDTVTISNNQQVMEAGEHQSICSHIYYFDATPPAYGKGEWSIVTGSGVNISQNDPNSIVTGLSKGRNVFRWSVQYNGCLSWDTVQIINGLPSDADAGPDQLILADNTFLNANDPTIGTGEWSLLNGAATFADRYLYNTGITGLMVGKNTFKWTITNAATGCSTSDTVNVTNNTADTTDAGSNQIICSSSTRLNGSDPFPGIGKWTVLRGSATFEDNTDPTTLVYNLARGENVLIWGVNLNGYTYDSVKIINNSPISSNAGSDQEICADSIVLNGNQPLDGVGTWKVTAGAGTFADDNVYNTLVTGLTYGDNRFEWTISKGGCTSSSEVTITNSTPTTAYAGQDVNTCKDTILLQPNTPAIGTGQWSVLSGAANFNGNYASGFATDDNYLLWTIRNSYCTSVDTVVITSNRPTTANAGANQSLCIDSVLMTASQPIVGTGIWSIVSGSGDFADMTDPNSRVRNLGPGTNIFKWLIDYNGCTSFDEVTISYDFVEAIAGYDQEVCNNRTFLEGNNPGENSGIWTIIGGASGGTILNPAKPNSEVINLDRGTNVFRWTISKNNCVSYDEVSIVNNMPSMSFAGEDQYLCTSQTSFNANPVTVGTGAWSKISGSGIINDSLDYRSPISNLGLGANTFRWTVTNGVCTSTDEVIIYNNQPVNVYAGLDQANCSDTAQLYAVQPELGTGQWSVMQGSATFDNPNLFNTKARSIGKGTNIFVWRVNTSTCYDQDTVEITNNNPTVATTSADQTICVDYAPLNANQAVYGTGLWALISGNGVIEDNSDFSTSVTGLGLGTNVFSWTITNQNCISTDKITITNNSPSPADAGMDIEVCQNSYDLRANSPVVGEGYWSLVSGYGIIQDTFNFTTNVSDLGFGPNTFRWTTYSGICSTQDEVIVTYNMASVDAGEPQTVYTNYTELKGNNPISGSGAWSLVAGAGTFDDSADFSTTVRGLGYNENRFRWTITNGICPAWDEVVIIYKPVPIANFEVNQAEGCPDLEVNFTNSTQNGTTYFWDFGDGTSSINTNPDNHTYTTPGRYRVLLTAYGPDGMDATKDTFIIVYQAPVADFDYSPDSVYVMQNMRCYNYSENSTSYRWDFGNGDSTDVPSPTYRYEVPGEYNVILWASNTNNCTDSILKTIKVLEDGYVVFPTAFSPSDEGPGDGRYDDYDGSNDVFHPHIQGVEEYHMEIYSRWGILLFESNDVEIGWDGYYKGKLLEKGVYVWKITGKFDSGRPFTNAGTFLLMR